MGASPEKPKIKYALLPPYYVWADGDYSRADNLHQAYFWYQEFVDDGCKSVHIMCEDMCHGVEAILKGDAFGSHFDEPDYFWHIQCLAEAMRVTEPSNPPSCWYENSILDGIIRWGVEMDWVDRPSVTQVSWTDKAEKEIFHLILPRSWWDEARLYTAVIRWH